jgi:protein-tyrosine phosphatase
MTLPPAVPGSDASTYRVSMVCLGNICRSPIAQSVLSARLTDAGLDGLVSVDSCGTGSWHIGAQADPRARAVLAGRGYDAEAHRARQFDATWFGERDLLVAMDHDNARTLRRLAPDDDSVRRVVLLRAFDPEAGPEDQLVPDPYYGDERDFVEGLDIIERSVDGLVSALRTHLAVDAPES